MAANTSPGKPPTRRVGMVLIAALAIAAFVMSLIALIDDADDDAADATETSSPPSPLSSVAPALVPAVGSIATPPTEPPPSSSVIGAHTPATTPSTQSDADSDAADADPSDPVPPGPVQFSEGFESASGFYDRFDTGLSGFHPTVDPNHIQSWSGDHDHSCAAPTTSREVHLGSNRDDTDELFWYCAPGGDTAKGHIMTSMNTLGYNALWFSPKPYFNDITQVCWDQNLTYMGGRKWTQVVISPRSEVERIQSQVGRLDLGFSHPGFQDPSGPTTHIIPTDDTVGFTIGVGTFTMWQGATDLGGSGADLFKTEDRAARYRHCATDNQNGTVTLTQQRPDGTHTWTVAGAFPNGEVRVAFHDTNYDPPKDDDYDTTQNTWHWDNITIA